MKKIASLLAALIVLCSFVFAEGESSLSFYNKVKSSIVDIADGEASFSGIKEEVDVEYLSNSLDFWVNATAKGSVISDLNSKAEDYKYFGITDWDVDWYVEFRPWQKVTFFWHDAVFCGGAYLPVEDDSVGAGNLGSSGLGICLRPIGGLRIAAGFDFPSNFGKENEAPKMNFGIDYAYGSLFSIGATARDVANDGRSFGFYAGVNPIEGLALTAGYATIDADGIVDVAGKNLVSFGASYGTGPFWAGLDLVTNFGEGTGDFDLYLGTDLAYTFNDSWAADLYFMGEFDFDIDSTNPLFVINPNVTYTTGKHTFSAGVEVDICGNTTVNFPVYWKYSF
jgi:hypothetical protein